MFVASYDVVTQLVGLNTVGGYKMYDEKSTLAVRSVSGYTREHLEQLSAYTRLTYGSLIDDAVDALWREYEAEGHDLS